VATLIGPRGLLVVSPVLLAAAVGVVLLWRRGLRAEAATAGAIGVLYLLLNAGYFLPYGGFSPGPRFFAPALPFLLLGLPLVFARAPRLARALAFVSIVLMTANALTWPRFAPDEPFDPGLPATVLSGAGVPPVLGVAVVLAAVVAALVLVVRSRPAVTQRAGGARPTRGAPRFRPWT
jgi:hypothetical protein